MRTLAGRGVRATASIFPRGSTSARSLRFRSESRPTRKLGKNKNSPPRSRPRRLPIRARLLGPVRDRADAAYRLFLVIGVTGRFSAITLLRGACKTHGRRVDAAG